jgi:hypothetical protein
LIRFDGLFEQIQLGSSAADLHRLLDAGVTDADHRRQDDENRQDEEDFHEGECALSAVATGTAVHTFSLFDNCSASE